MTMAVFDYSAIRARMERRPVALIPAIITLIEVDLVRDIEITSPAIALAEALERARQQLYRIGNGG